MALNLGNSDLVLTTAAATAIAASALAQLTILKATANNTDSSAHTITVYRVPNGGSPSASNAVLTAYPVAANTAVVLPLSGQTLTDGQTLQAIASVASVVNLNVSWSQTA